MKLHLTPDGPKPCVAVKRSCKYGEHFPDSKTAEMRFSELMDIENDFQRVGEELVAALSTLDLTVGENKDGRLESNQHEDEVVSLLKTHFKNHKNLVFHEAPIRHWYDCKIINKKSGKEYPINIKSTFLESGQADNSSSKKGMAYAISGKEMKNDSYEELNACLSAPDYTGDSDYYFLVIDKKTNNSFFTSLLRIDTLTPNGNNLPFQIKWRDNLENKFYRDRRAAIKYVASVYKASWDQRDKQKPDSDLEIFK